MIARTAHLSRLSVLLRQFPVVALLGPRQVGKTTLARQYAARAHGAARVFDLESVEDLALLADPLLTLRPLSGLIVLDEVQRRPEIFATLRVLADEPRPRRRFLVLGSASPDLLRQSSETLAGRIAYHELGGFGVEEVGVAHADRLWRRGGFPLSYRARTEVESRRWREELIRTYLERDLPSLGLRLPAPALRRGAAVSGCPDRDLHGAPAPELARESGQASGQGAQDLPPRAPSRAITASWSASSGPPIPVRSSICSWSAAASGLAGRSSEPRPRP